MIVSNERNDTLCNAANFMALMQTCLLCAARCKAGVACWLADVEVWSPQMLPEF